jgi:ABC-type lipoprotein release transport system permease subunit
MIRLILNSIRFYRRSHLGVLLGTALASAVLTGSLLVGDSVDGSLRRFALQRLGSMESAMYTPDRFFEAGLAERIGGVEPVLKLRGMALGATQQVNRVQVLGCTSGFWNFAELDFRLQENEAALNRKLAHALDVRVGDEVSLRIEKPGILPRDAPLSSQRDDRSVRGRFRVTRVLSDDELGRFSLQANQVAPYNAFVPIRWLEDRAEMQDRANLLVTAAGAPDERLSDGWTPKDFGLRFRKQEDIVQLQSDAVYLGPEASRAAMSVAGAQGTLTYLVNSVSCGNASTPYSFILAMEGAGLADDGIMISRWLAEHLETEVGDTVTVKYYALPASGRFEERARDFTVSRIAEMKELEAERERAPAFPGLTDVERCADWDAGIPMDEEQLEDKANEEYWNRYKQTPKAVISLQAGQDMWSNRFGSLTGVRWPEDTGAEAQFRRSFNPAAAGFVFRPLREEALAAVDNAMDFGQLFVGMSFFLIISAVMLTGLLFVFSAQQRAEEFGVLLATGWTPSLLRRRMLLEGGLIAMMGSLAGAGLGMVYTRLLIAGLSGYWKGAVAHSAITYCGKPVTIATGAAVAFVCAMTAMAAAVWHLAKHPARELLTADFTSEFQPPVGGSGRRSPVRYLPLIGAAGALGVAAGTLAIGRQSVAMPFFGAGALLLLSGVLCCGNLLRGMGGGEGLASMFILSLRNASRRRGRSLTVIGLLAGGMFLVFAVSSMKEDVTAHADRPGSGTGGFAWFGESTLPITDDIGGVRLRVRDGDDASCLNLNRARTPRLLGVDPTVMSARNAFFDKEDVWQLLHADLPEGTVAALVGDSDTALWGLEAAVGPEKGAELDFIDENGRPFKVRLVGKLPMRLSVFQGSLLVAEADFTERYPSEEGCRMFLLDEPPDARKYSRAGLDVVSSTDRLLEFYAVESTYLAMFLVLGALGLAVGSLGMGVVVLRNVQDRRPETALLRALGFREGQLKKILYVEHGLLLAAGLVVGLVSATVAMVPALFISHAQVSPLFMSALFLLIVLFGLLCMAAAVGAALRGDPLRGLRNE